MFLGFARRGFGPGDLGYVQMLALSTPHKAVGLSCRGELLGHLWRRALTLLALWFHLWTFSNHRGNLTKLLVSTWSFSLHENVEIILQTKLN